MKTSELIGPALDWAVAKCEELSGRDSAEQFLRDHRIGFTTRYSTNWSQGGQIIEREALTIGTQMTRFDWKAIDFHEDITQFGPTPLIAAMRCHVASKLGDEIEIPEELK